MKDEQNNNQAKPTSEDAQSSKSEEQQQENQQQAKPTLEDAQSSKSEEQQQENQQQAKPTSEDAQSPKYHTYQRERNKKDEKGFDSDKYSSEGNFNPFGSKESDQKNDSKNYSQSSKNEKNKYSDYPTDQLQTWQTRFKTEIDNLNDQYNDLSEKIEDLTEDKRESDSISRERQIQRKINKRIQERKDIRQNLERLEKDLYELEREIEEREFRNSGAHGTAQNNEESQKTAKNVTAQSLFKDGQPIENTVLFVATYFPRLNPQDFKRVVLLLLEERTKAISVKESITTQEGKIQVKETQIEKQLIEIWQESFDKPDTYLKNCYLKVSRNNRKQGIEFTLPGLKKGIVDYFEKEESLYLEKQLKRIQKLDLILDSSDDIAERVIELSVKTAIDYPANYSEDWLIDLLIKIAQEDNRRIYQLLERLSNLIYKLQSESDYSRSEDIAQSFLERFLSPEYRSLAFTIFRSLMNKHLASGKSSIQSVTQLLNWLKNLLNQENLQKKYERLQSDVFSLLLDLIWQSGDYSKTYNFLDILNIYDFIRILKEWLPEKNISPEEYIPSNLTVPFLLFIYCRETTLNISKDCYGKWSSGYTLFAPLYNESNNKISDQLDTLFGMIFYSDNEGDLIIQHVLNRFNIDINSIKEISFFISEWLIILLGFDDDIEPLQEVSNLIDCLIRQIILNTSYHQQKLLNDCWTSLTEEYLNLAIKYKESGNKEFQKQFTARRKILKKFRKQFRSLQKEMKTAK